MGSTSLPDPKSAGATGISLTFTAIKKKAVVLNGAANSGHGEIQKELIVGLTGA